MSKQQRQKKTGLLEKEISFGPVTLVQKALFAKHLAIMLKSGLTVSESLSIAIDSSSGRLKKVLESVLKSVQAGHSLSSSFSNYKDVFPSLFVSATYAGEESGTLDENLSHIAEQLEKEKNLVSKIKSAMFYPIVVLIAVFILGLVISFLVLPKIVPLFEGLKIELPLTTRGLIWFSHLIQSNGLILFLGVIIVVFFFVWLFRQKFFRPISHYLLLKTPVIKKVARHTNLARFCRTLATLLKSGLTIDQSLKISRDTINNYYYKKALSKICQRIGRGVKLSELLDGFESLFPKMAARMIRVGEESGKLEETLFYLADFYEEEVDASTKKMTVIIEPALLIVVGLLVAVLALSIITPIYEITGNIRGR